MIVITNGTEYIYLDEDHQIQKTTDISKAKTFTFQDFLQNQVHCQLHWMLMISMLQQKI